MAEFVVNVTLIAALLVLLVVWAVSAVRRRRQARREHAQQRRLILSALTAAAHGTPAVLGGDDDDEDDGLDDTTRPGRPDRTARRAAAARPAPARQLDAASIAALLDLLEDRRPARRGAITALLTSPRSVWSAGARAGQSIARHTTGERDQAPVQPDGAELYREAAGELAGIHAHDPGDARDRYAGGYAAARATPPWPSPASARPPTRPAPSTAKPPRSSRRSPAPRTDRKASDDSATIPT